MAEIKLPRLAINWSDQPEMLRRYWDKAMTVLEGVKAFSGTIAGGSGVNFNSGTGVISLDNTSTRNTDHSAVSVSAGTGLSGGGDITSSRTISLANTTVTPGSYGNSSHIGSFTVDAQGRLTSASNISVTYSDVGAPSASLTLTAGSGLTGGGDLSANRVFDVGAGTGISVGADSVGLDTTSTRNTDHASISISAGTGLSGGGTIAANRTLSLANTSVSAGSYGAPTDIPSFTVDAQGRLTSAASNTIPALAYGTATPTATGTSNIDSVVVSSIQYLKVGNIVTVSGIAVIDVTSAGSFSFTLTLPVSSNFTTSGQCGGALTINAGTGYARIIADATNDVAQFSGTCSSTSAVTGSFTFTYQVL